MEGVTDVAIEDANGKIAWLEGRFAEMGIRLFNDGSGSQRVWTHADISDDIDMIELLLRWS